MIWVWQCVWLTLNRVLIILFYNSEVVYPELEQEHDFINRAQKHINMFSKGTQQLIHKHRECQQKLDRISESIQKDDD